MINSVRNTVLAVANKQNFGYITPNDFNLYAKQAQLDIFETYFYRYNEWITKQNKRISGSGYADIVKNLEEVIDIFASIETPDQGLEPGDDPTNIFPLPSDYYLLNTVRYGSKEVERVSHVKILNLTASNLTAPSVSYPAYIMNGSNIEVFPETITSNIKIQYIRTPKAPNWTYSDVVSGSVLFDQSNLDYQDFELPPTDEVELTVKILRYAGISLRDPELYQAVAMEDSKQDLQKTQNNQRTR